MRKMCLPTNFKFNAKPVSGILFFLKLFFVFPLVFVEKKKQPKPKIPSSPFQKKELMYKNVISPIQANYKVNFICF